MGFIASMKAVFDSTGPTDRPTDGSRGAYWCDDCGVRIRDVDLEEERVDSTEEVPTCPDCGDEMRFERSTGRSCAC
ncbi:hypothetical protein ACFO5R_14455 [Halosolutus amylolyticus]|uniref:Small CPxCG-related zinc finger protein n=1 Tax=Halosolutus amylolyticus TaxID=2932267 RepID=A0ABD5PRR1_9EURY|nr:hypothetical protein [Halosolutus amylolyticus]